ncbi:hepatocellular carcinoma-associated antigen 66, partial [Aphelenchoides avenae]
MADFVEQNLERLVPLFERLKAYELLTDKELDAVIKKCRSYEYRCNKITKKPKDFLLYADYLVDLLSLIEIRRKGLELHFKFEVIELPLKQKAAWLHQICAERFKKREFFQQEVDCLLKVKLYRNCSQAYTRFLQFHGDLPDVHEAAIRFEFYDNKSAENARTLCQMAVRKFPKDIHIWATFFEIELHYVKYLAERRQFLASGGNEDDDTHDVLEPSEKRTKMSLDDVPDAVFQLKLAEIVYEQALEAVDEGQKPALVLELWRRTRTCLPLAEKLEKTVYDKLWAFEPVPEEAYLARIEREQAEKGASADMYELYDDALHEKPTEKMIRLYLAFVGERLQTAGPFAEMKRKELLLQLHKLGAATHADYEALLLYDETTEEVVEAALRRSPNSVLFWDRILSAKVEPVLERADELSKDSEEVVKAKQLCDEALEKVSPAESLPVWRKVLDLSVHFHSAKRTERLFEKAIVSTPAEVSGALRIHKLELILQQPSYKVEQ